MGTPPSTIQTAAVCLRTYGVTPASLALRAVRSFDALDLVAVPFDDVFGEGALLCGQKLLSEIVVQRDSCTPFFGAVSLRIIKLNRPTLKVHSVPCEVQDRAGPTGGVEGE